VALITVTFETVHPENLAAQRNRRWHAGIWAGITAGRGEREPGDVTGPAEGVPGPLAVGRATVLKFDPGVAATKYLVAPGETGPGH